MIGYLLNSRIPLTANGLHIARPARGESTLSLQAKLMALDDDRLKALYDAAVEGERKRMEQVEAAQLFNQPYPVPPELEEKVRKFGHFMGDWYSLYTELEKRSATAREQYVADSAKAKEIYEGIIAKWQKQWESLVESSDKRHAQAMDLLEKRRKQVQELVAEVAKLRTQLQERPLDRPTGQREADTLRKLVIGVAVAAYKYDPKAARSEVPTEIASDLQGLGLSVSDDTIRKHLRESADLLPPPAAPERVPNKR